MKQVMLLCTVILMVFTGGQLAAQDRVNESGDVELKGAIGGPNWIGLAFRLLPNGTLPGKRYVPWNLSANIYLSPRFSIGVYSGYQKAFTDIYEVHFDRDSTELISGRASGMVRRWSLGVKSDFHFVSNNRFDMYTGAVIGTRMNKIRIESSIDSELGVFDFFDQIGIGTRFSTNLPSANIFLSLHLGAKYQITPWLGIYSEVSLGNSLGNIGLTANF